MSVESGNNVPQGTPVEYVPEQPSSGIQLQIGQATAPTEQAVPTPAPQTVQPEQDEKTWAERIAEARAAQEEIGEKAIAIEDNSDHKKETEENENRDELITENMDREIQESIVDEPVEEYIDDTDIDDSDDDDDDDIKYPSDYSEDPVMDVPVGNLVNDVPRLTEKFNPDGDPEGIRERLEADPDDFFVKILQLFSQVGTTVDLTRDYLERLCKDGHKLTNVVDDSIKDTVVRKSVKSGDGIRQKLSGREAKLAVLARAKGLRKVHLLNSGFWVTIRPPRIAELSQWYADVSQESRDFGRLLGGHVFMFSDVLLRRKFMEVFPSLVVESNLENWRAPDRLAKMISIHDFDTIVWACCTLIYKEAITVNVHCTNEECQYVANNYRVDVDKIRFTNLDAIPEEAYAYLSKQLVTLDKVSSAQIKQYHKLLGFNKDFVLGDVTYKLHVPSIHRFIECGAEFIKQIMESIKGVDNGFDGELEREVRVNIAKTYLPWVSRVVTPDFETDDPEAIAAQMEMDVLSDRSLSDEILQYQYATKLSYFCYTMLKCPKCGKQPSAVLTDYYPLDPTYLFFFLFSRQLGQMTN